MTTYVPKHSFLVDGINPATVAAFNENVYEPSGHDGLTLYDTTTEFTSLDIVNGWLDHTIAYQPTTRRKIKDNSFTRVFKIAQNLNLDYRYNDRQTADNPYLPIPGACLSVDIPWEANVLALYNLTLSNVSPFESTGGVVSPLNAFLQFGKLTDSGRTFSSLKNAGGVTAAKDVDSTVVPAWDGSLGKLAFAGGLTMGANPGRLNAGLFLKSSVYQARVHCRSLILIAFRTQF